MLSSQLFLLAAAQFNVGGGTIQLEVKTAEGGLAAPVALQADGKHIDCKGLVGYSSPTLVDYDGDGDLDLVVGSFVGRYRLFNNSGTATSAKFDAGVVLQAEGKDIEVSNW